MNKNIIIIIAILLLGAFLRFYQLGIVPHGMTWDESAIGYNGYAILTTRRDEWLERLPVSFKSFGDYKAPLAIYLNGFFTYLFGMNLLAVRLPFAIFGVGSILGMIFLVKEFFLINNLKFDRHAKIVALVSGLMVAISPWHLHYSRTGFESGISLFFLIWATMLLFKFLRNVSIWFESENIKELLKSNLIIFSSITFYVASIYAYHSAKITTPLLVLAIVFFYKSRFFTLARFFKFSNNKKQTLRLILNIFLVIIFSLFLMRPLILDSIYGQGLARSGTLVFGKGYSNLELATTISSNFLAHLDPDFLIKGNTTSLRHGDGQWGVFFPTTFAFLLMTLLYYLFCKFLRIKPLSKSFNAMILFSVVWIFLGIFPATLGEEIPHSNRAFLAYPGFMLLFSAGLLEFLNRYSHISSNHYRNLILKSFSGMMILIHLLVFVSYLNSYYTSFASKSAEAFNDGYLEAFSYALQFEKGLNGNKEVDKIIFTDEYGQPYIYALFIRKTNPIWYQGGSLVKYEFKSDVNIGDISRENTLVVAGEKSDLPVEKADHLVFGSDGKVRFKIYLTDNLKD